MKSSMHPQLPLPPEAPTVAPPMPVQSHVQNPALPASAVSHAVPAVAAGQPVPPRVRRVSLAGPYSVGIAGLLIAVLAVAAVVSMHLQVIGLTNRVSQLQHSIGTVQSQVTSASDSGQSQLNAMGKTVRHLQDTVDSVSNLVLPYSQRCTADATGPDGGAAAVGFLCKP